VLSATSGIRLRLEDSELVEDNEIQNLKIHPRSLQAEVLDRLRDEIIQGVWKPGERLQERLLCERFGISRSPLREAYQVLAAEGLLDLLRNRGAVVSTPTLTDVLHHHTLLVALECLGIELACAAATEKELSAIRAKHEEESAAAAATDQSAAFRLNNELHRAVVLASHNQPLIDAHLVASRQIIRIQNVTGYLQPDMPVHEHDAFIEPLLRRSKAQAVKGLKLHLATVEQNLRERLAIMATEIGGAARLTA
jgi:DNA-binding GntR family transcriptional regulator